MEKKWDGRRDVVMTDVEALVPKDHLLRSVEKLPMKRLLELGLGGSDFLGTFCSHKKYPRGVRGREAPWDEGHQRAAHAPQGRQQN